MLDLQENKLLLKSVHYVSVVPMFRLMLRSTVSATDICLLNSSRSGLMVMLCPTALAVLFSLKVNDN